MKRVFVAMLVRLKTDAIVSQILILIVCLLLSSPSLGYILPSETVGGYSVKITDLEMPDRIGSLKLVSLKIERPKRIYTGNFGYKPKNRPGIRLSLSVPRHPGNMAAAFIDIDDYFDKRRNRLAAYVQKESVHLKGESENTKERYVFNYEFNSGQGKVTRYRHGVRYKSCLIAVESNKEPDQLDEFLQAGKNAIDIILDSSTQVPEPTEAQVKIRVELVDADEQLTPADEASLRVVITNTSNSQPLDFKASMWIEGVLCTQDVIRVKSKNSDQWISKCLKDENTDTSTNSFESDVARRVVEPGQTTEVIVPIRTATERNRWIYENLIKGEEGLRQDNAKPNRELAWPLNNVVRMVLKSKIDSKSEIFNELLPVLERNKRSTARLVFPDLGDKTGPPPVIGDNSAEELAYYSNGDEHWTYPGHVVVRQVALRAARYGAVEDVNMGSVSNPNLEAQLIDPGDPENWTGPAFPDFKVKDVVENIVGFVHQLLVPKEAGNPGLNGKTLALNFWRGKHGVESRARASDKSYKKFICQEHAHLLGGLLRALGVSVREVNVLERPFTFIVFAIVSTDEGLDMRNIFLQDAASQVYFDGKWNFFALFRDKNKRPVTDDYPADTERQGRPGHLMHYVANATWWWVYDMWVGAGRWQGNKKARFNMAPDEMESSGIWKFYGYGDNDAWVESDNPPFGSDIAPVLAYELFSPVVATVTLPDGKRIGATGLVDPSELREAILQFGEPPPQMVNEIPGASYYPETFTLYPDAADSSSNIPVRQTIILPAETPEDFRRHMIQLKGTGNGPYKIQLSYLSGPDDHRVLGTFTGEITKGATLELSGSQIAAPQVFADKPWSQLETLVNAASRRLDISANSSRFTIGDPLVITVDVDRDGYLNVLNLGPEDTVPTVLYPNQLHPDNRVSKGQRIRIPDVGDWFELQAQGPAGKNLIVVVHTQDNINAYTDGAGSPGDLFNTLSTSRGFAVKAKKDRSSMGAGKLELVVEW